MNKIHTRPSIRFLGAPFAALSALLAVVPVTFAQNSGAQNAAVAQNATMAQNNAQADAAGTDELPQVVVTAQFRTESLQTTPLAITAVSGAELAQRSVTDVTGLNTLAPSVNISSTGAYGGHTIVAYIRGVGAGSYNYNVEPGVGFYIDDVYLGPSMGLALALIDLERVEILRGPQGTLSGKNAVGGSIKLVTTKPKGDNSGYAQVEGGSYGLVRLRAAYDLSLIDDKLFMRVSGYSSHRNGYENIVDFACANPGEAGNTSAVYGLKVSQPWQSCIRGTLGGETINAARTQFRFIASDDLEFSLAADYINDTSEGNADTLISMKPASFTAFNNSTFIPLYGVPYDQRFLPPNPYTTYSTWSNPQYGLNWTPTNDLLTKDVTLNADWKITPKLAAKSITGYRFYLGHWTYDSDSSPLPTDGAFDFQTHEQFSEEARLSGESFGDRFNWTAGIFYYHARERDVVDNYSTLFTYYSMHNDYAQDDASAVYVHGEFKITDDLTAIAGLRESQETKHFLFWNFNLPGTPGKSFPPDGMYVPTKTDFDHFDYRFGLEEQFTPTFMLYGNVSTGFRSGAFNPQPSAANQVIPYGPEILTEFEIGARNELFDRRVRFNNTIYYGKYKDVQLTARLPVGGSSFPANVVTNTGSATIYGFESELQADVGKLLSFNGSGSYTHFRYTDLGLAYGLTGGPTLSTTQAHTPTWRFDLGAQLNLPVFQEYGKLTFSTDYSYQSGQYDDTANTAPLYINSYGVLNARLSMLTAKDWQVTVGSTNLTDRFYYSNKNYPAGQYQVKGVPSRPREWNLSVRKNF